MFSLAAFLIKAIWPDYRSGVYFQKYCLIIRIKWLALSQRFLYFPLIEPNKVALMCYPHICCTGKAIHIRKKRWTDSKICPKHCRYFTII